MRGEPEPLALAVENLRFAYQPGQAVLDGLSFSLAAGETALIAGLSGSGKSTLCHILCGLIPHSIPGELSGSLRLFGEDCLGKRPAEFAIRIALLFQDSDNQLFCTTLEDELAFGPENLCRAPQEIIPALERMLDRFQLQPLRLRDPARLSGGQKKLAALAAVLMLEPRIVILDEPMSSLDEEGRAGVMAMIEGLKQAGVAVLVVEHDLLPLAHLDRWLLLDAGRLRADAAPAELLADPRLLVGLGLLMDEDKPPARGANTASDGAI